MSDKDKSKIKDLSKLVNNVKLVTTKTSNKIVVENFLEHMKDKEHEYPARLNFLVVGVDSNDGDFLASEFEATVKSTEEFVQATRNIIESIREHNEDIAQLRVFVSENLKK